MILTEEEAKTKWCPQAMADGEDFSFNKFSDGTMADGTCCLGSACMMWQWFDPNVGRGGFFITDDVEGSKKALAAEGKDVVSVNASSPNNKQSTIHWREKTVAQLRVGFCGLARRKN